MTWVELLLDVVIVLGCVAVGTVLVLVLGWCIGAAEEAIIAARRRRRERS